MSMLIDFAIFPVDKGSSVSPYVTKVVQVIKDSGLAYRVGPMGTCIEGPWSEVLALVDKCFKTLEADSDRIYFTIKGDFRRGTTGRIDSKVKAVGGA
ncbi:MAG: MTH1187 family thiamine-binding protein [Syntrophaceae bacterium]|nr:MTH1187 family thiamine-binding protein [Syntrophaceae bacterium]